MLMVNRFTILKKFKKEKDEFLRTYMGLEKASAK